jgi:hypothetical protein
MGGLAKIIQPLSFSFSLLILCLGFGAAHAAAGSSPQTVNIVVAEKAPPQVTYGAGEIRRVLEPKGIRVTMTARGSGSDIQVYLGVRGNSHLTGFTGNRQSVPDGPESYAISVASSKTIVVEGSDPTGAMYGALDVAEQFVWAKGDDLAAQVKPERKSPYLQLRGVNMFITTQDIDEPEGAFWSDEYWTGYLDMMAHDRYNLLDIHGPCDAVTLTFPNGFSYFVSLPDYPEVGVGPERAKRNMDRLQQVVRMAADRGIKIAYMNYEAPAPIGPWKTRRWMIDERWVPVPQDFLNGPRLEDYTRKAVTSFLQQLPDLWMFGFRVGESGQPEDFYKNTYLAVLDNFPKELNLYVRTWIAYPHKVRELAASTKHHLYIEPKYNGEQLGSPYQAALGGRQYPPSGSYEDYTNYPRDYSILWQIRAHGTHRVFYWGSPDFARRTVRSCKFGDGVGFSMEPMEAYLPAADYLHNNPKTDHHFYKWMFEREWVWHLIWGRAAYDPDVPDEVFVHEFIDHFGAQAGPLVFKALTESSRIVPFVYSYHNVGLDHQDFAPEFETGDHAFGARSRLWQGTRLAPYGGNNDDFLRVNTLDRTAMADPAIYVDDRLQGLASGKMGPFAAADYLDSTAMQSEKDLEEAARLNPSSSKNFDCMRMDIHAVAWLGRYYRDRILSATHLEFYEQTFHHPELTQAYEYLQRAVTDWDRLSEVTEAHFGFVPEDIRMGVKDFRWRDEGRSLGVDLDQLDQLEEVFRHLPAADERRTIIGHVPPAKIKPGQPLTVTATYATASEHAEASLFFRNSRESGYTKIPLKLENRFERTFTGEIPADRVLPGYLEYYFEADVGPFGSYGGTIEHRRPYHVLVNGNDSPPVISPVAPAGGGRANSILLTVQVQAKAQLSSVRVYYKRTPAYYEWVRMEMEPRGGASYSANVPLTSEGVLYYFEAIDEDGNAANYPNFLERTPYLVVNAWDPAESAAGLKDPGRQTTTRQGQ